MVFVGLSRLLVFWRIDDEARQRLGCLKRRLCVGMIPLLKEIGGKLINGEDKGVDDFAEVDVMVGCGSI